MPLSPSSMASPIPHHFYPNYTFTTTSDDLLDFPVAAAAAAHASLNCNNNNININNYAAAIMDNFAMWGNNNGSAQDCFFTTNNNNNNSPLVIDNGALDHVLSSLDCDTIFSANWIPSNFGEQLGGGVGVSPDFAVPAISSDRRMGLYGGNNNNNSNNITGFHHQSLISNRYQPRIGEFGEECCGFVVEDIKPQPYPNASRENWGIQGNNNQMAAVEEPNIKVGRYSEEERKERILRHLKKRNQRNFNKTIKYACRKTLADRRVRVRGRFARNNELCEDQDMASKKHDNHHLIKEDFDSIQFQLKNDDEDWLQEAMASLVYLSQSSPEDM